MNIQWNIAAVCQKLRLGPGEKFLDVGCGWGALLRWAATHYGVIAHGITLSEEQVALNRKWISDEGLGDVGLRNYNIYFRRILSALKPGGLFLNHGIVVNQLFDPELQFLHRYIFPDGQCAQLTSYLKSAHEAGWEIVDVDSWRPHYAKTLRCWVANLEACRDEAVALVGKRFLLWQFYLTMCAQGFESGRNGVYQMLLRTTEDKHWNLPLTRKQWLC